jgi:hypothetical protein
MSDISFRECFISGLKEEIRSHILMARPTTWLEATHRARKAQHVVTIQIKKPAFISYPHPTNPSSPSPPLKIHKLTRDEMVERQLKGLCYNCDDKYFPRHKCEEQKCFMAISKDILEDEGDALPQEPLPQPNDYIILVDQQGVEPHISLHVLTSISAPQTLKLISYIKHRKVIVLIDYDNTHNFIPCYVAQETHCYIHAVNNFQIMIINGGSMKCGGRCENVRLQNWRLFFEIPYVCH